MSAAARLRRSEIGLYGGKGAVGARERERRRGRPGEGQGPLLGLTHGVAAPRSMLERVMLGSSRSSLPSSPNAAVCARASARTRACKYANARASVRAYTRLASIDMLEFLPPGAARLRAPWIFGAPPGSGACAAGKNFAVAGCASPGLTAAESRYFQRRRAGFALGLWFGDSAATRILMHYI